MENSQKPNSSRPKVGLALGSGSARGWSHIGIIEALLNEGIKPDIVCGCSIGAFVGSAYVAGKLDYLKEWALSLTRTKIMGLMDVNIAHGGIINGDIISDFLRGMLGDNLISQYPHHFAAIATDLKTGREIWLQEGLMHEAVRASISIPGIFAPFKIGDRWLLDGGLVNPVPISICRAMGADIIIAVNLNNDLISRRNLTPAANYNKGSTSGLTQDLLEKLPAQIPKAIKEHVSHIIPNMFQSDADSPGYFDVLVTSLNIMQDKITKSRLAAEPPQLMLTPRLNNFSLMDFFKAEEAIKEGHECVVQSLPQLRRIFSEI